MIKEICQIVDPSESSNYFEQDAANVWDEFSDIFYTYVLLYL